MKCGNVIIYTCPSQADAYRQFEQMMIHLEKLVAAHKRGEHPYGSMRRDCPLCSEGKLNGS